MRNLCSSLFDDNCATVLALATMGFGLVLSMICGGASARLGSRLGRCSSRGPMGLGSSYSAQKFPSSHALMLAMILMFTPMASGVVCQTCKDTISGCAGGAACPLLKGPMDNAATLRSAKLRVLLSTRLRNDRPEMRAACTPSTASYFQGVYIRIVKVPPQIADLRREVLAVPTS